MSPTADLRIEQPVTEAAVPTLTPPRIGPRAASEVLIEMHEKTLDGRAHSAQPVGLGFDPLDKVLGGGIRPGDLLLLGGAPGAGKTTFALRPDAISPPPPRQPACTCATSMTKITWRPAWSRSRAPALGPASAVTG